MLDTINQVKSRRTLMHHEQAATLAKTFEQYGDYAQATRLYNHAKQRAKGEKMRIIYRREQNLCFKSSTLETVPPMLTPDEEKNFLEQPMIKINGTNGAVMGLNPIKSVRLTTDEGGER